MSARSLERLVEDLAKARMAALCLDWGARNVLLVEWCGKEE